MQRDQSAQGCERDHAEDQQRLAERFDADGEKQQHHSHHQRQDHQRHRERHADPAEPGRQHRQERQEDQLAAGVARGQQAHHEAAALHEPEIGDARGDAGLGNETRLVERGVNDVGVLRQALPF